MGGGGRDGGRGAALGPKPPAPRRRARPRVRASPDSLARASAPQDGATALDDAKSRGHTECIRWLENPAAARAQVPALPPHPRRLRAHVISQ